MKKLLAFLLIPIALVSCTTSHTQEKHTPLLSNVSTQKNQDVHVRNFVFSEKDKGILYRTHLVGKLDEFGFVANLLRVNQDNQLPLFFWKGAIGKKVDVTAFNIDTEKSFNLGSVVIKPYQGFMKDKKPKIKMLQNRKVLATNEQETWNTPVGFTSVTFKPPTEGRWALEVKIDSSAIGVAYMESAVIKDSLTDTTK
ncbi:hypothetical protein [Priestia megaterium]|uniref:hypothetical protein n=1 Tax=Priestia megaterium TaxID=1404 RepID=UPI00272F45DB|nr:hypothetical protein [Priestia megaterium]MDP1442563.1 hypothetical protein [Priestia megaterium]MDP1471600.1 hypothetical protein [Priestia megaterium]MDR0132211.1 hypothetical protein [Priestia megaterium]MDR4221754.1 hypothetical protein [Priestia megaterium]